MEITLKQAGELIEKAKKIVISSHVRPDGDNVGSTLGLYHTLKALGKELFILLDDDLPDNLYMMNGLELYTKPAAYPDGLEADLMVLLDVDQYRIGDVKKVVKAPILNLDHHLTNARDTEYYYVDPDAPATCAVVFQLIKTMNWPLNQDAATCLYTGLASDTGFFKYNATGATFEIARDLVNAGADSKEIAAIFESRTFASLQASIKAANTIELLADGKLALMTLDEAIVNSADNTEGFVNIPRVIRGVDVAVMLKYDGAKRTKVSFRSKITNVSKIAEELGGGGHKYASAAVIHEDLATTREMVLKALAKGMA